MIDKARQYKPSTIRRLDTLSGNECAEPNCTRQLIARDGESIVSKICHIRAASPDGPRYDSTMDDEDRRHYDNLILLCDECHTIIDNKSNEDKFPRKLLEEWKKSHANKFANLKFNNRPSLLSDAINAISGVDIEKTKIEEVSLTAFKIPEKITYNTIKRNKSLIEDYKIYHVKINTLYDELEKQGSFKKEKLLQNINRIYIKTKGKYVLDSVSPLQIIQDNSDQIIDDIYEELLKIAEASNGSYKEDITLGVSLIMVDAFMRCKILEEPK